MQTKKINLKYVSDDKEISIPINTIFYRRLNKLFNEYSAEKGTDEFLKVLLSIKHKKTENNDFAFNIETLMMLLKTVEYKFDEAGHMHDNEIEVEVPDEFESTDPSSPEDPQP